MRTGCDRERKACGGKTGFPAVLALTTATLLAACAVPSHYAGIDLRSQSSIAPEIQTLAQRAQSRDKHAQLELGIRYEEGKGVPPDVKQARRLYRMAAATTGGTIYVYQPPVKKGGRGGVVSVNLGPVVRGLEAAMVRLKKNHDKPVDGID